MPRVADHDERRRQMADAVRRIVAVEGMEGVTFARAAEKAGVSVGLVGYYFSGKDELLLFTFQQVCERTRERVTRTLNRDGTVRHLLRRCLLEFLPLDTERTTELRVYLAFCGRAVDNPRLRAIQVAVHDEVRAHLAEAIEAARQSGEIGEDADPAAEAAALWAFVDGLAMHAYAGPGSLPPDAAVAALHGYLARLFPA
ncbi:TetR/AcrR family transcriptional regulator [Actinomadura formosensis]|uniref:TetR/AcrR family transcriptional regulator n=1 Tax=Actinomadura formosensis TaxID=60706 RepID=UPI000833C65E|nr:TetR/AcrR family transcriptional regulator [Actinomadura formosensis]